MGSICAPAHLADVLTCSAAVVASRAHAASLPAGLLLARSRLEVAGLADQ